MKYCIGSIRCIPSDELMHWGIPGMHWGERRYQNYDGTLTPLGKARYAADSAGMGTALTVDAARARAGRAAGNIGRRATSLDGIKAVNGAKSAFDNAANAARTIGNNRTPKKSDRETVSRMTDKELRERINRMQMEQQYLSMSGATRNRGAEKAAQILSVTGSLVGIASGVLASALALQTLRKG